MARPLHSRLKVSGKFVAETPLHVGGLHGNADSDMALAINGKGDLYIPGTSLTGVLRAWCERNFTEKVIKELFGFQESENGQASFLLVEDATIENVDKVLTETRDGVGIDRYYGTAAEGAKYDREILPKGTRLNFQMTVEIGESQDANQTKTIFGHLLEALQKGELRFGGSRTRGLGRLRLESLEIKEQKLRGKDEKGSHEILKLLSNGGNLLTIADLKGSLTLEATPWLNILIDWSPVQPLMVKAGFEGIGVDMLPLTSQKENGKVSLVLPGSSIKGSLRSHAERIMRTLLPTEVSENQKATFHDQISSIPLIDEIFGAKAEKGGNGKKGLGALAIDDCFAVESFDTQKWTAVQQTAAENDISAEDWTISKALNAVRDDMKKESQSAIHNPQFVIEHHTAIDRFTGGVAEGALYSILTPNDINWDKMQLSLDFSRLKNPKQCLMLILLLLRDLAENRLPLGFATNRGMGEIKINSFELIGRNLKAISVEGEVSINLDNSKFVTSDALKKLGGKDWWKIN
jgi:CRISPR/Cas system CSM-associated protein Csm3 (group 7 of RAMP superfamily)